MGRRSLRRTLLRIEGDVTEDISVGLFLGKIY